MIFQKSSQAKNAVDPSLAFGPLSFPFWIGPPESFSPKQEFHLRRSECLEILHLIRKFIEYDVED